MNWLQKLPQRLRALLQKSKLDAEMDEEMRSHIEMRTRQNIEAGMSPEDARFAALRQFGWVESIKEMSREGRGVACLEDLVQDVRYGGRMLRKNPGFTAVAVLTLALGIGANTAIFSVINAVVLRPMAVERPQEIVAIIPGINPATAPESSSWQEFQSLRQLSQHALQGAAAVSYVPTAVYLGAKQSTHRAWAAFVSANYWSILGVKPAQGRTFVESDDAAGANPVVMLSERAWRQHFGGDPTLVGKSIRLNDRPCTVVGIVPDRAAVVERALQVDVFVPVGTFVQLKGGKSQIDDSKHRVFDILGRLEKGVTPPQAQARFDVVAAQLQREFPDTWLVEAEGVRHGRTLRVVPEAQLRIPPLFGSLQIGSYLAVLGGVVGMVLLIACSNLANLLLARATTRQREVAMRLALGATRTRLVRQLVTENLLLAGLGAIAGLLLANWAVGMLAAWNPASRLSPMLSPVALELGLDFRVFLFASAASLVSALLFGLAPAWRTARLDIVSSLKLRAGSSPGAQRGFCLRQILIVGQVGASLVLLAGTGLLVRSLVHAQKVDLGFDRRNIALLTIALDQREMAPAQAEAFVASVVERVQNVPGVEQDDVMFWVPLGLGEMTLDLKLQDYNPAPNEKPSVRMNFVGTRFAQVLGVPTMRGHGFSAGQTAATEVIINEAMAKRYWPNQEPVGKRLLNLFGEFEIVGVTPTMKYASLTEGDVPMFFLPTAAWFKKAVPPYLTLTVRTSLPPGALLNTLRAEVQSLDADLPILDAKTMDEHLALRLFPTRFAAVLAGVFGGLAVVLAALGLYGVMAYFVSQRTAEIGIRIALGAQKRDVLNLVLGEGMKLAGLGVFFGVIGASATTRALSALLLGVTAIDPLTFVLVTMALLGIAASACLVPAVRAARLDPMLAMRQE